MQELIGFSMDHRIDSFQELAVPFDTYFISALVFVVEKATNKSLPITKFAVADPQNNFVTSSVEMETRNNFTYDSGSGVITVEVESRALRLQ